MLMSSVSIITVNFNQPEVTEALLTSIAEVRCSIDIEVIVIDNGSRVNPVPNWERKYPNIKFIRSEENLGFSGGNNLGIRIAKGDYLFFINNDTELTSGLIETLANDLDNNTKIGIISPKIRYFDEPDVIQYAGFTPMNYYTARNSCIGQYEKDKGQYDHYKGITGFIHGAAMMARRQAINTDTGMPECFFLYYEEMDWCEEIKRNGYEIWVDNSVLIYHKESVSVGRRSKMKEYFMNRNRILYVRRNTGLITTLLFCTYFMLVVAPRNILGYIKNKETSFISMLIKAIWWNCTHSKNSTDKGIAIP